MRPNALAAALAGATLVVAWPARPAWADRIALLPSRGGADAATRARLDGDVAAGLQALGHTLVPAAEAGAAAAAGAPDGTADSAEEYRAIAAATKADWVVVATVQPAVVSARVEVYAYLAHAGRVESVAREVDLPKEPAQVQEMLEAVVRPQGVGIGELPWEKLPPRPAPGPLTPPAPPLPAEAPALPPPPVQERRLEPPKDEPPIAELDYLSGKHLQWPPYAGDQRVFLSALQGFAAPAVKPSSATGGGGSIVGLARAGYALGDLGLEGFGELGGNLAGPPALWVDAGLRWLRTPSLGTDPDGVARGRAFFLGPEVGLGAFVRLPQTALGPHGTSYTGSASASFTAGASLDLILAVNPSFAFEAQLGNLRLIPTGDGLILLLGATLGAGLRF